MTPAASIEHVDPGVGRRDAVIQRRRFVESDLYREIERSLGEVRTRIDRLVEGRDADMSDAELDTFVEIDRLLYDVVLDLARLEASELTLVGDPS